MSTRGSFHRDKAGWGAKMATQVLIVPRLNMHGAIRPLPHTSSWRGALLFTISFVIHSRTKYVITPEYKAIVWATASIVKLAINK
jgi:hypothetical protein